MDCMNSWRGDKVDMAFRIMNEGGDGGFKFFCERDEDDALQQEQFVIKLRSFTLAPSEFYLNKG
jgi:putative heme iron utilization protein